VFYPNWLEHHLSIPIHCRYYTIVLVDIKSYIAGRAFLKSKKEG
jgi:hypothetical protein